MSDVGINLPFDGKVFTPDKTLIRRYQDIPSIRTLRLPEIEYKVPALAIPRKSVTMWCGPDGAGKTFAAR